MLTFQCLELRLSVANGRHTTEWQTLGPQHYFILLACFILYNHRPQCLKSFDQLQIFSQLLSEDEHWSRRPFQDLVPPGGLLGAPTGQSRDFAAF